MLRIVFLFWIAFLPASFGFAQTIPSADPLPREKPAVSISADHLVQEGGTDIIKAKGNVIIRFKDRVLHADQVRVNQKTGIGEAKGHVLLTTNDGTLIKAKRSLFNMKSKYGKAFDVIGKFKGTDEKKRPLNYYFKGKEIKRLSPVHYKLKDSYLTTCSGKVPDWSFEAKNLDVIKEDRALFTRGVFKVKNVPILYFPIGYLPLNKARKSGFLIPKIGTSNTDGFTFEPIYYWVINDYSDATIAIKYLEKRGVQPDIEYRYTPSKNTKGEFNAKILDDRSTGGLFYKVDWRHDQVFKHNTRFKAKLDLESENNFNKTFEDDTNLRTRQNTDSFASLNKSWSNSTLDILVRYRDSTQDGRDDTFAQLPQITYQHQRQPIGKSSFLFNQETSYTSFLLDLNTDPVVDDQFQVHRFDFHPQISRPIPIAPWLAFTPTLGWRETIYSKGLSPGTSNKRTSSFTRELIDINGALEGPKINKIYFLDGTSNTKINHVIEPRVSYDFIPNIDENDRAKIRIIDGIDSIKQTSIITYSLTQRLLKKSGGQNENAQTREILRFDVSQSFDFNKDTQPITSINDGRAFSDVRFDLDSRLYDGLLINLDTTYNIYDGQLQTLNFEVGVKPLKDVSLFAERRFIREQSTFFLGSIYWAFKKGWQLQASTRYDELTETFREIDLSLLYDNPCKCWGFSADWINRDIITGGTRRKESKFLFTLTLRGIGTEGVGDSTLKHIHRRF
ncbi:MAG: LPS-assembly protein LptD [Nitrospinae bacterium]|nr:LPS-assembly protein LptD [Nitrospinota bacterium]